jgi:hypothetical protein
LLGLVVLAVFAALVLLLWLLWLNRYVVYTPDGVKLDFTMSPHYAQGVIPTPPDPIGTVPIYDGAEEEEEVSTELVRFSGVSVSMKELMTDTARVEEQLLALPQSSTICLELKSVAGYVCYTSKVAPTKDFDPAQVDALLRKLMDGGYYLIARIPASQEYQFIMADQRERVPYGLPQKGSGTNLWLDRDFNCYWLNPASDGTITYLIQLITELRSMGFDEVLFSDFRFPRTEKISFSGDQQEALDAAASTLVRTCATDTFCVSFIREAVDLQLPEGRTRLYLTGIDGTKIAETAALAPFADPAIQLGFLTDSGDTRYDNYCVLRPLKDPK